MTIEMFRKTRRKIRSGLVYAKDRRHSVNPARHNLFTYIAPGSRNLYTILVPSLGHLAKHYKRIPGLWCDGRGGTPALSVVNLVVRCLKGNRDGLYDT